LFSELKNDCQTGGILFYNKGVLTCNNTNQIESPIKNIASESEDGIHAIKDSSSDTITWSTLTSYPSSCSVGQAVQVIGDTLTCFSVWDDIGDLPLASPTDGDGTHLSTADQIYDWVTGRDYITNDSSIPKNDLSDSGDLSFDWSNDEIADNLTINSSSSVTWSALTSYPSGCSAGQAVQVIGDTPTCISIGGSSLWTDGGDATHLSSITDDLAIGGTDNTAPLYFDVGTSLLTLTGLTVNNTAVFNEAGGDSDFRVEGDSEESLFLVDAGTDEVRLGDWDTNYAKFAKDGELTLIGTARVIIDLWIGANTAKAPGAKPATFTESGLTGVWQFDNAIEASQESISGTIKIPAEMDRTVVPMFKIGWSTSTIYTDDATDNETAEWQLKYLWIGANEDTTAAAQETLTQTTTLTAATPAEGLVFTVFTGIDLPEATDQAMFFKITRLSAGNDTIADTLELRGMNYTYTKDKLGTAL